MKIPKAFTDDSDLGMCYEKKVIIVENVFYNGDLSDQIRLIHLLLQCMKESNQLNSHNFPFYQLRVRPSRIYEEQPEGICFELRWGNREELKETS